MIGWLLKIKHLSKIKSMLGGTRITAKNTKSTTKSEYKSHQPQISVKIPQWYQERKGTYLNYHLKATRASTIIINHVRLWWYQTDIMEPSTFPRLVEASKSLVCCMGNRNEAQKLYFLSCEIWQISWESIFYFCLLRDKKGIWFCVFGQIKQNPQKFLSLI